jgi:uncharacterized membrane protein YozB (DUF420 family)
MYAIVANTLMVVASMFVPILLMTQGGDIDILSTLQAIIQYTARLMLNSGNTKSE